MKWPRGKYNGQRIEGAEVKISFRLLSTWSWCLPNSYGRCLGLGPLRIWFEVTYESERKV